jgi:hypothetical protein
MVFWQLADGNTSNDITFSVFCFTRSQRSEESSAFGLAMLAAATQKFVAGAYLDGS